MSIFISVATAFLCFFLILYFRRMDKRNTQLQTLKNFIASSINNMKMMFQDKEKELLDKTINLDISLKKLDKASTYINNKLMDIKDTLASFQEIKEGISGDIKQASKFNGDITSLREKLSDINAVTGDVDGLKREMNDMKKLSDDLRSEVEESRDWIKSSIEDFRANALAELDDREREIDGTIEKQISEFSSVFTVKADEVRKSLSMTIEEYKKETDVAAGDIINGAKELKESVNETLGEFNGRWNETVKRFNEMNRDVMSKTSIMESRLEKGEKDLEIRLEDARALINTRTGEMTRTLTLAMEAGAASIEDKKAELAEKVDALSAGLDRQLGEIEDGYNGRIEGMDERISSLKSEIDGLQDKITSEAQGIFNSMENEIAAEIDAMKKSALGKADERLKNIEEMYSKSEAELEDEFNKQINDINSRLVANSSAINEMGGKLSGFVRDVTDKFKDDVALLQKEASVEARDVIAEIGAKEKELNALQQSVREEIKVMGREAAESALQRIRDREKEIINMIEKSAGSVGEKVSRLDNIVVKFESEFDRSQAEIGGRVNALSSGLEKQLIGIEKGYKSSIDGIGERISSLKGDVDGLQEKITGRVENLFGRLENDIAGEIEELKKSALEKAGERLKALEDMYSKSGEDLEEDFNKKASEINSRLVANSSAINELGGKLNTFVRDVTDKFKGDVAELQKQASVQARDVIGEIGSSEKELGVLMQAFREEIKVTGRETAESALQRIKDREKEIITIIEKSAGSINEKILRLNGTVEHFESDFDKAQHQIAGLQEKITGRAENLFGRLENDIAGEIEELKKSALEKAGERLKALEDMYSKSGEDLEEDFNKKVNDINARLVSNSSAINELGGKLNTFVRDVTDKFKGDVAELQKQASVQARDVIGEIGNSEKELGVLMQAFREEIKVTGRETAESALQRIKDREKEIITIIEKSAGSINEKILRLNGTVEHFESDFEKAQHQIAGLQEKITGRAENLFGRLENGIAGEIEELKKSALEKAGERLKALEDMYSKSGEDLEEDFNKKVNDINARLVSNSSAINELGGKLNTFVRDVTDKFKGDVAELQKQASVQAKDVIGEIGGKQKELNALLLSVRDEIKGLGREASESALQRIKDREKEIINVIEKNAGSVGEKIARLDSSVDQFEEGFNKKLSDTQASIMNELQEYKNNVEKLKVMGSKAEGEIDIIVAGKAEEMGKFINDLKIEFAGEYEGLLSETRGEIKTLVSEVAQVRSAAAGRKDLVLKEVAAAIEEARGWSLSQIGALKDEIESAKLRTGAMIEDIRDESETMLKDYNSSLSRKLEETLKGADADFMAKKSELKDLTNDMIVYVNEKDKEINKRIERLNTFMDDAVKKSEGQIISINRITEQRFQKFYEELAGKGEEGIHNFRQEIDGIVKELKTETLTTIELYKNELTGLKKALSENREGILVIEKGMDSGKGAVENIRQEIASLEKAIDMKKAGFENLVKEKMKEIYNRIEIERSVMEDELAKLKGDHSKFLEGLRDQDKKFIIKSSEENIKILQETLSGYKLQMEQEIAQFKGSFLPPTGEIIENLNEKADLIQEGMEKKAGSFTRDMEDFISRMKDKEGELAGKTEAIVKDFASKINEYKDGFSETINSYIKSSGEEYKKIFSNISAMEKELKTFEEKTVVTIRDKAVATENDIGKKLKEIANNFDAYVKKSGEEVAQAYNSGKKDISSLMLQLKSDKEEFKAGIVEDIRELGRKTKDIETRYDSLLKKTGALDRAEGLAARSNSQIELMTKYVKDLESRKKDIEESLKTIDQIRTENRDLNGLLMNLATVKKETAMVYQTVTEALQKARETEGLLSNIEKQQGKAEEVRKTLVDTLKLYEDIKVKAAEVEKKKDVINKIMNSVENSREDLKDITVKITGAEDKITGIVKISKKIEDDIKTAQAGISRIFGEQDRVSYALDKIVDIENLLAHIEEESKKVQKMRDWVAKLETKLERIKETQESALDSKPGGRSSKVLSGDQGADEDVIKNILRLKEQEWSIEDISKSLKISRAYVELILERYVQ